MSNDSRKIRFGLWYDFRNPAQWRQPADRLYREILDQIAWGENNGFDDVWLSEHHFIEDGYLPSILPAAAAIAARTNRIRIASGVLLMPFHNPIRLAEDIATVDVISGGRFELGVGIGFKREEFTGFGVSSKERGARTDQSLDIIRRALSGETVTFKSDFFDFQNIKVTPEPIQKPHPPVWLGGFTPPALRRAVRFGDGFTVPGASRDVYDRYVAELATVQYHELILILLNELQRHCIRKEGVLVRSYQNYVTVVRLQLSFWLHRKEYQVPPYRVQYRLQKGQILHLPLLEPCVYQLLCFD